MTPPEHRKWRSIQRLSSEQITITEKIDGTNAVVWVPENKDDPLFVGSRERWLTNPDGSRPDKKGDNFGFAAWVHEREAHFRLLPPGYHYGEFFGAGIQRKYDLTTKHFVTFFPIEGSPFASVPTLYEGEFSMRAVEDAVARLREHGSVLIPGFMKPEGVVIRCHKTQTYFKKLCENDALHKYQQAQQ